MSNFKVTVHLRTPEGEFPEGSVISSERVAQWPSDTLANRIRLGDIVPSAEPLTVEDGVEEETDEDPPQPLADTLALMTKAEIAKFAKTKFDVDLKEGNKESMIAETVALAEAAAPQS